MHLQLSWTQQHNTIQALLLQEVSTSMQLLYFSFCCGNKQAPITLHA